jgi:hypothetical protein
MGILTMQHIGYVNAEGGPLLLIDARLASDWQGTSGNDYERACKLFDSTAGLEGGEISVGTGKGLLWEIAGPGTADVFKQDDNYLIVRVWPADPSDQNASALIANQSGTKPVKVGTLLVTGGTLAILWAAEDASLLEPHTAVSQPSRPKGETAIDDSILFIPVSGGTIFTCVHDQVETDIGMGRRLRLTAKA